MEAERIEAVGQRGEDCIIVVKHVTSPTGEAETTYSLATGERLRPTEVPGEFVNLSGTRTFKVRE